jgi:TolB-like protein/Tfp pilus assembly protein PilF
MGPLTIHPLPRNLRCTSVIGMAQTPEYAVGSEVETGAAVSAASVRGQMQRILASNPFRSARRLSRFLSFVVESKLANEEGRIKEYLIGVEVCGRPEAYDPKDDPIVRVEAGRLRKKLDEYYGGPGASDSVIIELPKGGYVPAFHSRPPRPEAEAAKSKSAEAKPDELLKSGERASARGSRAFYVGAAALVFAAAAALAFAYYVRLREPRADVPTSIAVLPFLDLSTDPAAQYRNDGFAEELTTGLAQLTGLRVVAATSAFQFRNKSGDVRTIGQSLNAQALLEGSISQSGSNLRINAQLVNTRNGYHLWSKVYELPAVDMLSAEQDIVQETARALRVPMSGKMNAIKRDTGNPEAHDLYLQGRYLWSKRDLADMQRSAQLFERAVADDPNYALAYVGVADAYTVMAVNLQMSPAVAIPRAKAALQRALELDPNLAQAHATLGLLKSQCEWNWHGGEAEFRRAIELQPNYAEAHHWAGLNYTMMGQFGAAEAELRQAQVLDPLSLMITEGLAENFYYSRRYDDVIATVLKMPDPGRAWIVLARAYTATGRYQDALKTIPTPGDVSDPTPWMFRADVLAVSGDRAGALKILQELERNPRSSSAELGYLAPADLGFAYAMAGEKEQAVANFERAVRQHDPDLARMKIDPATDRLRSDPSYRDLLK